MADATGAFLKAYAELEWRDKLWKFVQNLARIVSWAQQRKRRPRNELIRGATGIDNYAGAKAAALARGLSTSRKGFRLGKWLRPLQKMCSTALPWSIVAEGTWKDVAGEASIHPLAQWVAWACMVGYGVWDNLVFLYSVGVFRRHRKAQDLAKMCKIRSHKFRFCGNVLDVLLACRRWLKLRGESFSLRCKPCRRENSQGKKGKDIPAEDRLCVLQMEMENSLRVIVLKACSAFESFSHSGFCVYLFGRAVSPGLIGLSGVLSSSIVLQSKWPATD